MASGIPERRQRRRAVLRFILGLLQVAGATAGLYLLVKTGVSRETAIVVGTTLLVSITSRIVFRAKRAAYQRDHGTNAVGAEEQKHYGNSDWH